MKVTCCLIHYYYECWALNNQLANHFDLEAYGDGVAAYDTEFEEIESVAFVVVEEGNDVLKQQMEESLVQMNPQTPDLQHN